MPELLQGEVSLENILSAMQFIEEKGLKFYEENLTASQIILEQVALIKLLKKYWLY